MQQFWAGGEIGKHAGLRNQCRKAWRFKSSPAHQFFWGIDIIQHYISDASRKQYIIWNKFKSSFKSSLAHQYYLNQEKNSSIL